MAVYIPQSDLVIMEMPKTGTQYIRESLNNMGVEWEDLVPRTGAIPRHERPMHYSIPDGAKTVGIVRLPHKWLWSFWSHFTKQEVQSVKHHWEGKVYPHDWLVGHLCDSYDRFAYGVLGDNLLESYMESYLEPCDLVIRNEELRFRLIQLTGLNWPAERINTSPPSSIHYGDIDENVEEECDAIYEKYYTSGLRIEIGGGTRPNLNGLINIDQTLNADLITDLNSHCLPLADDSVERVYSSHCLEHIKNPHGFLDKEICRVCRVGASVEVRVPHPLSDAAMVAGHESVLGEMHFLNAEHHFTNEMWTPPKRLKLLRTDYGSCEPFFSESKEIWPNLSNYERMRFIPRTCHECQFHFEVVPHVI